ncbi:TetR/AcrR family transcriptional regulator [Nocardia sp. CDC153]|uniref:TetR/AcrR family transcriptional regulator n=1 Tax=Nocardia sp. CDC153 TaxID=3112167 RepID=UPI002DBE0879|nr:TetR/AcrR family transcriptional regulator [Nocardia sp. CDC153]MEC3955707.1 TetR/AcrR family transcriptional regulator [Nocardia sp. CDC153]
MAELRADARGNRDQILAAAQLVFREQGVNVSMKDIADAAGVGVGTLYRRFPDRGALISATAHSYLSALSDLAATAERESPDAWHALSRLLRECAELRLGAIASAVEPALHADIKADPALTEVRATITTRIARLTTQAHTDGTLRPDVTPEDIARLMTLQIYTAPDESHPQAINRVLDLLLKGLRP